MNRILPLPEKKQKLLHKAHLKKYRNQQNIYFGEGYRLLTSALENSKIKIEDIILTDKVITSEQGSLIVRTASNQHIPIYRASERQMRTISTEVTPPGIFFTIAKKFKSTSELQNLQEPVVVYLEQISDAGNLGTVLRSMVWFGIHTLILSPGCVEVYNPKAVRASAGALFSAEVFPDVSLAQAVALLKPQGFSIAAAVTTGGLPLSAVRDRKRILLVFGSEAEGLSSAALRLVDLKISIPSKSNMDSLNLAVSAGIMFYHFRA